MLKREITYEDFDGNSQTEVFYFNLTKTEIIGIEVDYEEGLEAALKKIIASNDRKSLVEEFQKIILMSYGVRSEDGKRFIKNDQLREEFSQTAAYDSLFIELSTDAKAAADFVNGIIPKDLAAQLAAAQAQGTGTPTAVPGPLAPQGPLGVPGPLGPQGPLSPQGPSIPPPPPPPPAV